MSLPDHAPPPRLLHVDDDPVARALVRNLLHHAFPGIHLRSAGSAEEALAAMEAEGFDLLVSDLLLPGKDGVALLAHARRQAPRTTRILVTGHATLDAALRAVNDGGAARILTKPLEPRLLARAIREAVDARHETALRSRAFARAFRTLAATSRR